MFWGFEWAHLIPFRATGLVSEIPDFGVRYRFAMLALFPSRNLAQTLSYAWCRRHCSSIQEPGAHGGTVFKKSAAVCASLSTKVLDYSIFRLIMHKNPGFCGILYEQKILPGFYSNPGIGLLCTKILEFTACLGSICTQNPGVCCIFRFNMNKNHGFYSIFRLIMHNILDCAAFWNLQHF